MFKTVRAVRMGALTMAPADQILLALGGDMVKAVPCCRLRFDESGDVVGVVEGIRE